MCEAAATDRGPLTTPWSHYPRPSPHNPPPLLFKVNLLSSTLTALLLGAFCWYGEHSLINEEWYLAVK